MMKTPLAAGALALLVLGCAGAQLATDELETEAPGTESDAVAAVEPPAQPPQAPPETDIFLIDFDSTSIPWQVRSAERMTDREAYDNQPYFESDGMGVLYTAFQDGQTDVYRHVLGGTSPERLTQTEESEYSPTPVPGWPGFSTVRVEADGTQRLWRFSYAGATPEIVFEDIAPVGYHAWLDPESVALFVLGEPHELVLARLSNPEPRVLAKNIGRALHRVPGQDSVSYVDKSAPEEWQIKTIELESGEGEVLVATPAESEDFVWWTDQALLIGQGSKLFLFELSSEGWVEVADLEEFGINGISRLAVAPYGDRLAVVFERLPAGEPRE